MSDSTDTMGKIAGALAALAAVAAGIYKGTRGDRKSALPPHHGVTGAQPVARVEIEALARKVASLEDEKARQDARIEALDRRLDQEVRERLEGERETAERAALTNAGLERIVGRMDGHAEARALTPAPTSRRRL